MDSALDFNRYEIRRNGKHVNKDKRYFVLNIDDDPNAQTAFTAYADEVKNDNPKLYQAMMDALV